VPKFNSDKELIEFLQSEGIRELRPQAKVIRVISSEISKIEHKGTMFRKRMSKKKNIYKQLIAPFNKHLPPLFMLTD